MRSGLRRSAVVIVGVAALVAGVMGGVQPAAAQTVNELTVFPDIDEIQGDGWSDGATITLEIDDPGNGTGVDYTAQTTSEPGAEPGPDFTFLLAGIFDVQAGQQVTVTDGTTTKTHTVTELTVTGVDADADTVSGTAAPGSEVWASYDPGPPTATTRTVQVDPSGNWTADFSVPGDTPEEQDLFDIQPGLHGRASQIDNDGDRTSIDWNAPPPSPPPPSYGNVVVFPVEDHIGGQFWPDGATITLEIDDPDGGLGDVDYTDTTVAHPDTGPYQGHDFFFATDTFDVKPGQVVSVTDGATTRTHTVRGVTVSHVDTDADTVSGTSEPGSGVGVGAQNFGPEPGPGSSRTVQADETTGEWTADFSQAGDTPEEQVYDIQAPAGGWAITPVPADDGFTQVFWQTEPPPPPPPPGLGFVIDPNSALTDGQTVNVIGSGWIPGASLNIFECRNPASQPNDCDSATQASVVTDSAGQFTTAYTVSQMIDPPNAPGTDCGPSFACVILVQNPSTNAFSTQFLNFGVHTATVSGTVLDGAGSVPGPQLGALVCPGTSIPPGAPPPGCGIFFGNQQTGAYTTSGLSAGTYTIGGFGSAGSAILGAGTPVTRTLGDGEQLTGIDFVLGSRIEGHITDPNGAPVQDATVSLLGGPASIGGDLGVTTDANGYYQTPYLGAGSWTLEFHDPVSGDFGRGTVTVAVNATATLDVQLEAGASISGTVVGDSGPLPDTFVVMCPDATTIDPGCPGLQFTSASATGAGEFTFPPPVFAGSYAIAGHQGSSGGPLPVLQASPAVVVDVAGGDTVTCDFVLGSSPSASCTGATGGDSDGVPGSVEDGAPNNGDGNNDGTPDSQQDNVASLPNAVDGEYVSLASPGGTTLVNVQAIDPATLAAPPGGTELPVGVFSFQVQGVVAGATVPVEVFTPAGTNPNSYLKFQNDTWIDFSANASFASDVITLSLTDGGDGDADGQANGVIVDPGAPGVFTYAFDGFFAPVNNTPTLNAVNAGRAIPVKFSLGGDQGLDVIAAGYPKSQHISCDSDVSIDGIEETVAAGQSSLSYDASSDTYTYVWKTGKSWADSCRQLVVKLADGTVHRANFKFK